MVAVQCMAHRAQPPYDLHKDLATKPTSKHIGPLEEKRIIGSHLHRKKYALAHSVERWFGHNKNAKMVGKRRTEGKVRKEKEKEN